MPEWLESSRTTNGMRLLPPVSLRTRWARYKTGHGVGRHRPRGRHRPVPAVDQPGGRGVVLACRLGLRERGGRLHIRYDLAGAVALVVPDAQDVDVVRGGRGVDLEGFGLPHVHAHRRGEALD